MTPESLAKIIRTRKRELKTLGYSVHSQTTYDLAILVVNDLQHRIGSELAARSEAFDREAFNDSCDPTGLASAHDNQPEPKKDLKDLMR